MPDTKITALTAISTVNPATYPLPIVDTADTTMAASGTTKKITVNQILGSGGTATLASATITGDLTVDTSTLKVDSANNRVGIVNASPSFPLDLTGTGSNTPFRLLSGSGTSIRYDSTRNVGGVNRNWILGCDETAEGSFALLPSTTLGGSTFTNPVYRVTAAGVHTFFDGAGGTYATLNSTGLGVGVAPIERLTVAGTASVGGTGNIGVKFHSGNPVSGNLAWLLSNDSANSNILNLYYYNAGVFSGRAFVVNQSGNFMVRTPSTPPTIPDNEMMVFNLTSNTNLRISVKGTDGTVRTANITLA